MSEAERIFETLIAPIEQRMARTIARIVVDPDDAADALQNALAEVWRDLARILRHPNPHAYILRVCVSASLGLLRKRSRLRRREISIDLGIVWPARYSREPDVVARDQVRFVANAIASLPRKQAQAVAMRAVQGWSFEEIAVALECTPATARSHVSKGRSRLRRLWAQSEWMAPLGETS